MERDSRAQAVAAAVGVGVRADIPLDLHCELVRIKLMRHAAGRRVTLQALVVEAIERLVEAERASMKKGKVEKCNSGGDGAGGGKLAREVERWTA